jgi:hypothetical protein
MTLTRKVGSARWTMITAPAINTINNSMMPKNQCQPLFLTVLGRALCSFSVMNFSGQHQAIFCSKIGSGRRHDPSTAPVFCWKEIDCVPPDNTPLDDELCCTLIRIAPGTLTDPPLEALVFDLSDLNAGAFKIRASGGRRPLVSIRCSHPMTRS